jgi:hypothetical protein
MFDNGSFLRRRKRFKRNEKRQHHNGAGDNDNDDEEDNEEEVYAAKKTKTKRTSNNSSSVSSSSPSSSSSSATSSSSLSSASLTPGHQQPQHHLYHPQQQQHQHRPLPANNPATFPNLTNNNISASIHLPTQPANSGLIPKNILNIFSAANKTAPIASKRQPKSIHQHQQHQKSTSSPNVNQSAALASILNQPDIEQQQKQQLFQYFATQNGYFNNPGMIAAALANMASMSTQQNQHNAQLPLLKNSPIMKKQPFLIDNLIGGSVDQQHQNHQMPSVHNNPLMDHSSQLFAMMMANGHGNNLGLNLNLSPEILLNQVTTAAAGLPPMPNFLMSHMASAATAAAHDSSLTESGGVKSDSKNGGPSGTGSVDDLENQVSHSGFYRNNSLSCYS